MAPERTFELQPPSNQALSRTRDGTLNRFRVQTQVKNTMHSKSNLPGYSLSSPETRTIGGRPESWSSALTILKHTAQS